MTRTPVHIVSGFLGAGKTTLLRQQLAHRQTQERCAVLVNDFGEARFDATLLEDAVGITEIPGGCVCCTAPEGFVTAVEAILDSLAPDRIFIEPTGLARPCDLLDTLARSPLAARLILAPIVVVVDPMRLLSVPPPPLLLEQADGAEILIANRTDMASDDAMAAFRALAREIYPPLLATREISHGNVEPALFDVRRSVGTLLPIPNFARSRGSSTEGYAAASRSWDAARVFDMHRLERWLQDSDLERAKGIFRTEQGWRQVERASGAISAHPTGFRGGSMVDLIIKGTSAQANARADDLDQLVWVDAPPDTVPVVRIADATGWEAELTRHALAALPGQVPDVSVLVPGRMGEAVRLDEVLNLIAPPPSSHFIVIAHDGMTTDPVPVEACGDAVLVHSLGGKPVPDLKGGPYRIYVPPEGAKTTCGNVKGVARIVVVEGG